MIDPNQFDIEEFRKNFRSITVMDMPFVYEVRVEYEGDDLRKAKEQAGSTGWVPILTQIMEKKFRNITKPIGAGVEIYSYQYLVESIGDYHAAINRDKNYYDFITNIQLTPRVRKVIKDTFLRENRYRGELKYRKLRSVGHDDARAYFHMVLDRMGYGDKLPEPVPIDEKVKERMDADMAKAGLTFKEPSIPNDEKLNQLIDELWVEEDIEPSLPNTLQDKISAEQRKKRDKERQKQNRKKQSKLDDFF